MRPARGQVVGCIAVGARYVGRFRSVWLKLRRSRKGQTGRAAREKSACGDAVGLGTEAINGRFSRTATITGSFVALSRCCDKGGEECRGGIGHQKWGFDEGIRGEEVGSAFERGRSLARGGRGRNGRVVHRSSSEQSSTPRVKSRLLKPPGGGGTHLDGDDE